MPADAKLLIVGQVLYRRMSVVSVMRLWGLLLLSQANWLSERVINCSPMTDGDWTVMRCLRWISEGNETEYEVSVEGKPG